MQKCDSAPDLLACVLPAQFVSKPDWAGIQALDTQYVGDHLQQRAADGAWRIPLLSGEVPDLYVLLMLKNQSRPEQAMA